jgi:hypothetical protein
MNRIRAAAYCARAHQREPVGRWTVLDWKLDRRWAAHEDITESLAPDRIWAQNKKQPDLL